MLLLAELSCSLLGGAVLCCSLRLPRFHIMGGECNYLLRVRNEDKRLEFVPDEKWKLPCMLSWREEVRSGGVRVGARVMLSWREEVRAGGLRVGARVMLSWREEVRAGGVRVGARVMLSWREEVRAGGWAHFRGGGAAVVWVSTLQGGRCRSGVGEHTSGGAVPRWCG